MQCVPYTGDLLYLLAIDVPENTTPPQKQLPTSSRALTQPPAPRTKGSKLPSNHSGKRYPVSLVFGVLGRAATDKQKHRLHADQVKASLQEEHSSSPLGHAPSTANKNFI